MAEKKDKYLEWVEQGKLRQKLNATIFLLSMMLKKLILLKISI